DTVVRNCFFRCSDDIFAIYGNTGFYDNTVAIPGLDVKNILIENCVLSTSISNIMRVGWPRKVFNSNNVVMRNCDVIHAGQGGCVVPFALAEFWADPDGKGVHSNYVFDDIRMDNVYSIAQLLQSKNGSGSVKNIRFKNIRLSTPPVVHSAITGACSEISFENIKFCDHSVEHLSSLGLDDNTLNSKVIKNNSARADFQYNAGLLQVGQSITFNARASVNTTSILQYTWNFGDGFSAQGARVSHAFQDLYGTHMDGTGKFQVKLTITDEHGLQDVIVRPVIIGTVLEPASTMDIKQNGLSYRQYSGAKATWAELQQTTPDKTGVTETIKELALSCKAPYTLWFHGYLEVPVSGGYTFYMMSRDGAYLQVNAAVLLDRNVTQPQVCNTVGNVVQQYTNVSIPEAGLHKISFGYKQDLGSETFALYWQGPSTKLEQIPMSRFFKMD
ncbi:MAG: PKD domain-containing protein, partial [Bacteroidota bacterium]